MSTSDLLFSFSDSTTSCLLSRPSLVLLGPFSTWGALASWVTSSSAALMFSSKVFMISSSAASRSTSAGTEESDSATPGDLLVSISPLRSSCSSFSDVFLGSSVVSVFSDSDAIGSADSKGCCNFVASGYPSVTAEGSDEFLDVISAVSVISVLDFIVLADSEWSSVASASSSLVSSSFNSVSLRFSESAVSALFSTSKRLASSSSSSSTGIASSWLLDSSTPLWLVSMVSVSAFFESFSAESATSASGSIGTSGEGSLIIASSASSASRSLSSMSFRRLSSSSPSSLRSSSWSGFVCSSGVTDTWETSSSWPEGQSSLLVMMLSESLLSMVSSEGVSFMSSSDSKSCKTFIAC